MRWLLAVTIRLVCCIVNGGNSEHGIDLDDLEK